MQAKETFARQQPPEVRILKYLLSLDADPKTLLDALASAFEPGQDLETTDEDFLTTYASTIILFTLVAVAPLGSA